MVLTPKEVSETLPAIKGLLESWMKVKLVFQKAFSKGEITREQENAFLQLKSDISRAYRNIMQNVPKDLHFEGDQMMEMLKNAISMQHLQSMPWGDKRNLFSTWHKVYMRMTRTYGAFEVIEQGYYPSIHREILRRKGKNVIGPKNKPKVDTRQVNK